MVEDVGMGRNSRSDIVRKIGLKMIEMIFYSNGSASLVMVLNRYLAVLYF